MKFFDLFWSAQAGTSAKRAPLASLLEPRMLFDGAVAATVADAAANSNDQATADSAAKNTSADDSSQHASATSTPPPAATSDNRHDVVFIDGQVGDKQQLIDGLKPGTEVVVLDSNKDGLQQIAEYLKDRSDIDAIHIISHGDTGKVQLGNGWLDNSNLAAHGEALASIGKALSADGDILLYGCTVGANGQGQDFIQALAAKTGADVAASDDATGAASRGGDWVLERQVGSVETTALQFGTYSGLLANGTITFNANDNGNWADGIAEDGNGGSTDLPGIAIQISNVTDTLGTPLGLPLVYGDAQSADQFFAVTTYDASVQGIGWKGMQIRSADGAEFKLGGFEYWNYGELADTLVMVKGYRDGVEVANTSFSTTMIGFYQQKNVALDGTFGAVDSVILYTVNGSWHGLNALQIADPVYPPVVTTSGGTTAFTEGNNVTSTPVVIDSGITLTDADSSTLDSATVSITGNFQNGQDVLAFTNNPATMGNISGSYNAGNGQLFLSSAGATATVAQWQAALRSVTYTDSSNSPNTSNRTVSFVVNDGNSNSTAGTKVVSVTAVNDTPVTSASGGQTAFTEGNNVTSTPVVVDSGFTVTDLDNSTLASTNVSITGNFQSGQDLLAFTNNPATMGNISGFYNSGTGVLALSSAGATATLAQWQAALRSVTYSNSSDTPNTSTRVIAFAVNDGVTTSTASKQVTVAAANDTPVATASGGNTAFTEGNNATSTPVAIDSGITLSDLDNSTLAGATVAITGNLQSAEDSLLFTNNPATMGNISGSYNAGTGVLSLSSAGATATLAQWQAALRSITYYNSSETPNSSNRTLSFTVNDGSADSAVTTKVVTVAAVNDTPIATNSGGTTAFTEGNNVAATPVVVDSGFTVSDIDSSTLASASVAITGNFQAGQDVLAFTNNPATMGNISGSYNSGTGVITLSSAGATATLAQWQAALRSVTYSNSAESPNTGTRTLSFTVNDGNANSSASTKSVSVSAVNDTPVTSTSGGQTAFTEGNNVTSTPVVVDSGITLSDADNNTLASATVAITANFQSGEDVLSFTNNPATMGNISASYNAATGVMTLSSAGATATLAQWQAALRSVTYTDTAQSPNISTRLISFSTNDGAQDSNIASKAVAVNTVDNSPITSTSGGTTAFTEGNNVTSTLVAVDSGISLSDSDTSTLASATVAITGNLQSGQDVLGFTNNPATMGNISASYNSATGVLSLSSAGATATLAQWQAALRSVTYSNSSEQPNTSNRTVSFSVNDGNSSSNLASKVVSVTAVNDAPVNSLPGAQALQQDGTLTFNTGNGNLISISDTDGGGGVEQVTLTATNGLLTLSGTTGLVFLVGSGTSDATVTFQGTLADINIALNGLTFIPTAGYNGAASLQITSDDLGLTGPGGNQTDSDTLAITVNPNNPVVTGVSASDGSYGVGTTVNLTLTFSQAVNVDTTGGTPTLLLETGSIDRNATYVSGSGSNTLTFSYIVQAGDVSADLDYASGSALALNGATIQSTTGDQAILTLPTPGTANSLGANNNLVIDGVAATVTSVTPPAGATYGPGQNLDFIVNLSEAVTLDTTGGTPRLAVTLDTGGTAYANYVSGSGTSALVFRLTVSNGQADSNGISLGSGINLNGGTLRDSAANDSVLTLNNVGSTAAVLVDAAAPQVGGIVLDGPSPTNASSVSYTVTFTEDVTGVDISDFSLVTSGGVAGTLQSVVQINAHTYQVLVDGITGLGSLGLNLNTTGTGISDSIGNASAGGFSGPTYTIGIPAAPPTPPDVSGDPEFRANPPVTTLLPPAVPLQPLPPVVSPPINTSPLLPVPLFEVPSVGSGIPPLGNIFINQNPLAPSYIAQVFASSDSGGDGGGAGFLGFGGGDGGIFGSSSLSGLFSKESAGDVTPIKLFDKNGKGGDASNNLRGAFGAQTLGEQLHQLHHNKQQQVQELAQALGQLTDTSTPA